MRFKILVATCCVLSGVLAFAAFPKVSSPRTLWPSGFEGKEIGLILVVSPRCAACNHDALPDAWDRIVTHFSSVSEAHGGTVSLAGVAITPRAATGWEFLSRFGEFHEVSTGKNWENEVARKYAFGAFPGPPAVPQVIQVTREVVVDHESGLLSVSEEVVQRRIGLSELLRWAEEIEPVGHSDLHD